MSLQTEAQRVIQALDNQGNINQALQGLRSALSGAPGPADAVYDDDIGDWEAHVNDQLYGTAEVDLDASQLPFVSNGELVYHATVSIELRDCEECGCPVTSGPQEDLCSSCAELPVCDGCDCIIHGDVDYHEVTSRPLCDDCAHHCGDCGDTYFEHELVHTADGLDVCDGCAEACDGCRETYSESDLLVTPDYDLVCSNCSAVCDGCEGTFLFDDLTHPVEGPHLCSACAEHEADEAT